MTEPILRLAKPTFADLSASYKTDPASVHDCTLIDPTLSTINTCAARITEALVIANKIAGSRAEMGKLGTGNGDGTSYLLGKYGYGRFGKLCPHGIGRGAQDVGAFLAHHWGGRSLGWTAQAEAPVAIEGKTGVVVFMKIPGFTGQAHVDLWNKTGPVGHAYWSAATIWFWQLP
jgi:hypothetical protein